MYFNTCGLQVGWLLVDIGVSLEVEGIRMLLRSEMELRSPKDSAYSIIIGAKESYWTITIRLKPVGH
jgi:hypothetical protein